MELRSDLLERKVHINRAVLLDKLRLNREQHIADYRAAVTGYKQELTAKLNAAFKDAVTQMGVRQRTEIARIEALQDDAIPRQAAKYLVSDAIVINMPVPKSYEPMYNLAIDIAELDVRDTLELTLTEFNAWMRDVWDWSDEFANTTKLYFNANSK